MSKTAQRKDSFYAQGYNDRMKGNYFRWHDSHRFIKDYKAGWKRADKNFPAPVVKKLKWWQRLLKKVGMYGGR